MVTASSLFSVTDADGDPITQYRFWDDGLGESTGYFRLNGVRQIEGAALRKLRNHLQGRGLETLLRDDES